MNVDKFLDILDVDFYTGVPDSQLRPLCDCLRSGRKQAGIYGVPE